MDIKTFVRERALEAKKGARALGRASENQKNAALELMARGLRANAQILMAENAKADRAVLSSSTIPAWILL